MKPEVLAIQIALLTGRYIASSHDGRSGIEWPPHPGRLFSALVAALHADEQVATSSVAALQWLEQQPPPVIHASRRSEAGERTSVTAYCPVNDTRLQLGRAAIRSSDVHDAVKLLPEARIRQPRVFNSATPAHPAVAYLWTGSVVADDVRHALAELLDGLVSFGHPSSLVSATLASVEEIAAISARTARFRPDQRGTLVLRWVSSGQLARLEAAHQQHRGYLPRRLPSLDVRYEEEAVVQ